MSKLEAVPRGKKKQMYFSVYASFLMMLGDQSYSVFYTD